MPRQLFQCEFCDKTFPTESECIEHEQTHSKIVPCIRVGQKQEIEATLNILETSDKYDCRLKWGATEREMSVRFVIDKNRMSIEVKSNDVIEVTEVEGERR